MNRRIKRKEKGRRLSRFRRVYLENPEKGLFFCFEILYHPGRLARSSQRSLRGLREVSTSLLGTAWTTAYCRDEHLETVLGFSVIKNNFKIMINNYKGVENVKLYDEVITKLRDFFKKKGFVEVNTQDRLSILAACEDPTTVATFNYAGELWPLPQTGQMWLEYELLQHPEFPGVFCTHTSFRNEQNPIPGRHKLIFPLFEFESKGNIEDLKKLEAEALEYLGFGLKESFIQKTYDEMKEHYQVDEISSREENKMEKDFGPVVFLERFPVSTSPFWNMKKTGDYANKIDVIMYGMETIGSAERSSNKEEMREQFETISNGKYARMLYDLFGCSRVDKELDDFLSFDFFPRFGGAFGMSRLMDAYQKHNS